MPVMLEPGDESVWLDDGGPAEWRSVLDPYPDDQLRAYPVSKRVNNLVNNTPDVIEEIDIGEHSGLGEFGASN